MLLMKALAADRDEYSLSIWTPYIVDAAKLGSPIHVGSMA